MRNMRNSTLLYAIALLLAVNFVFSNLSIIHAQQTGGNLVAQQATHNDAAVFAISNKTSATTVTITPPAGQFVYVTAMDIANTQDATGVAAAAQTTITTTGFAFTGTNGVNWAFTMPSGAAVAGANTSFNSLSFGPGGLKSAAAGTAVTIVTPTFATHQNINVNVYVYFAP